MENNLVHLKFNKNLIRTQHIDGPVIFRKELETEIIVLKLFPGITQNVVAHLLQTPNLKGVVLETYGSGNAPTDSWFIELLKEALKAGIHIVNVTQCTMGSVIPGQYETSVQLEAIGLIDGKDITTEAALAKLMYLLGSSVKENDFKSIFETSLRGEMS